MLINVEITFEIETGDSHSRVNYNVQALFEVFW